MNIQAYIESNLTSILEAGQRAYHELGRGALIVLPQRDNGKGMTQVSYMTQQVIEEVDDKSKDLLGKYDPINEVVLIVALDLPQRSILVYTVDRDGARLHLHSSDL